MNVLETFFWVFEADARKLVQGIDTADKKTDQLEKNLKDVDAAGTMVGKSMLDLAYKVGGVVGSFLAFSAIKTETLRVLDFVDALNDSAEAIGVNVSELHAWDNAAKLTGGTTGGFINSLKTFSEGVNSIAIKGKGLMLPFFKELGLSLDDIKKGASDPIALLGQLSDRFSKLGTAEAAAIGAKIGLDQGTINLLREGKVGLEELIRVQKESGVVTKEQAELAAKANDMIDSLAFAWDDLKRRLILGIVPALTAVIEATIKVVNWLKEHRVAVLSFLGAVAGLLIGLYTPAMIAAAAATWALIAPYLAIGLAIAAFGAVLALVTDDLYNFMEGNDSVIGEIAKKWPIVGEIIRGIGRDLSWLMALFAAFTGLIVDAFVNPEQALDNFTQKIAFLIEEVRAVFPKVAEAYDDLVSGMSSGIELVVNAWKFLVDIVSKGIELFMKGVNLAKSAHGIVGELFGGDATATAREGRAALARGQGLLAQTNVPIASTSSSAISNSVRNNSRNTTINVAPTTVNTQATDGAAVSSAISNNLGAQIKGAVDQMDDGVAA